MVNFRFHLVSLTAVFLALAVGIGLGATVVDQATVEALQRRLDGVSQRVDRTDAENERLRGDLGRWTAFAEEASNESMEGRLTDVPVVVVSVQGTERAPVEALQASLVAAGARYQATLWLTSKWRLNKPEDTVALAGVLGATSQAPDAVRGTAMARVAASLGGAAAPALLGSLRDAAFLDAEAPAGDAAALAGVSSPETLFVVVSSAEAEVPNEALAVPLASQLARVARGRVLAAEPGREPQGRDQPGQRALFVGPLREDATVSALLSTVDNLEDFRGRFATVYALRDLGRGKAGHFGVGPRATSLVPEAAS
ncbi:MAG: copper transporter [Actinomycetota bacterium]|nr:copper transporter [Actinomycetota bacterium]